MKENFPYILLFLMVLFIGLVSIIPNKKPIKQNTIKFHGKVININNLGKLTKADAG